MGSCYQCGYSVSGPGVCASCRCYNTEAQCGCGSSASYVPQPYYTDAPLCEEQCGPSKPAHNGNALVSPKNQWNVPEVGEDAILAVEGFCAFHIGSYIWSSVYGYFRIVGFNKDAGQITVRNMDSNGNASPGTSVPLCSDFIVTDPPFESGGGDCDTFPHVAVDFTAPSIGNTTSITVTTVNGLAIGKLIQIGTGVYTLVGINLDNVIDILNEGEGIVPGTVVPGLGDNGECVTQIIPIDTNVCTNEEVEQGALVVCFDGIQQILDGAMEGSVPVLVDAENNLVEFQLLDVPTRTCTPITGCCVTLNPGTSIYFLTVGDSSIFEEGDLIQLGSLGFRFEITDIADATHITVEIDEAPDDNIEIAIGTSVCIAACCEQLEERVEELEIPGVISGAHITDPTLGILSADNLEETAETAVVTVVNPSSVRSMLLYINYGLISEAQMADAGPPHVLVVQYHIQGVVDGVAGDISNQDFTLVAPDDDAAKYNWDQYLYYPSFITLAPGDSVTLRTRVFMRWVSPNPGSPAKLNFNAAPRFLKATLSYAGILF